MAWVSPPCLPGAAGLWFPGLGTTTSEGGPGIAGKQKRARAEDHPAGDPPRLAAIPDAEGKTGLQSLQPVSSVATSGGPSSRTSVTTGGCSKDRSKRSGGLVDTCGVSRSCPTTSSFSSVRPNPTCLGACSTSSPVTPTGTRSGIADRATSPKDASKPLSSRMASSGDTASSSDTVRIFLTSSRSSAPRQRLFLLP